MARPDILMGRRAFLATAAAAAATSMTGESALGGGGGDERRAALLPAPTLEPARIVRRTAGLRPYRAGGIRLEAEPIGRKTVVHDYGHGGAGVTLSWGSAIAAADLVRDAAGPAAPVAVLGSGAVGLAAAKILLERGHPVRVLARDFPPRTTSDLSGAVWLPVGVETGSSPAARERYLRIAADSWRRFADLASEDGRGVVRRTLYDSEGLPALPPELAATRRSIERLPFPGRERSGVACETFLIEPPVYLPALLRDVLVSGATIAARTFRGPDDLAELREPAIVDCLGLGAGEVFSDAAVEPVRGQLVHLFPEDLPYLLSHRGGYVFPRRDAVILGGTFEHGVSDPTPDPAACHAILERHRRFFST